jgi:hypothetical protein
MVITIPIYEGEYGFRHCVVASTWAFEAQGPGSIPGGGAIGFQIVNISPDRIHS